MRKPRQTTGRKKMHEGALKTAKKLLKRKSLRK
jgi:hypothetical protein